MRQLIVNADGYGFAPGVTRAIEECIDFGTVRSLSANVNFPAAQGLVPLLRRHPDLSVGCHLNPIVGPPVLPVDRVASLVGPDGEFHYRLFRKKLSAGQIRSDELRAELEAQVDRTREFAGNAFSHVDFHMGLHRLPRIYPLFLDIARASGTGRIRTHRYRVGLERGRSAWRHWSHLARRPAKAARYLWNLALRRRAKRAGLSMPDSWVEITEMGTHPDRITVDNFLRVLENLPEGIHELVAHPAYPDAELRKYSTYLEPREREREVLTSERFREGLRDSGVRLAGYRDIPRDEDRARSARLRRKTSEAEGSRLKAGATSRE